MQSLAKATKSPLLPERSPQGDFFVCDIFGAAPKGDMASMAHPVFSLSTKPDRRIRRYESGPDYVEIKPSADGLATIHDRDVLIYCISQLIAAMNDAREISQSVRFRAVDLLKATNRMTNGQGYDGLRGALERLSGTRIITNIVTGDKEITRGFGLIESFEIVREGPGGRMQDIEIKLSDWVFNAIESHEVLTLHRDYFRLRKPLERRIYELARKHCGRQERWRISFERLREKTGSASTPREFRRLVKAIIDEDREHGHMPDYAVEEEGDNILLINRRAREAAAGSGAGAFALDPETFHDARTLCPGWDIRYIEQEWRSWMLAGGLEAPRNPDQAFLGFCRKWQEPMAHPEISPGILWITAGRIG